MAARSEFESAPRIHQQRYYQLCTGDGSGGGSKLGASIEQPVPGAGLSEARSLRGRGLEGP